MAKTKTLNVEQQDKPQSVQGTTPVAINTSDSLTAASGSLERHATPNSLPRVSATTVEDTSSSIQQSVPEQSATDVDIRPRSVTTGDETAPRESQHDAALAEESSPIDAAADGIDTAADGIDTAADGINTAADGIDAAAEGIDTAADGNDAAASGIDAASGGIETASGGIETADAVEVAEQTIEGDPDPNGDGVVAEGTV